MRIVKIVEEKTFIHTFVCRKCGSTIEIESEDILVGWFGANYGGETPDKRYYVYCPVCEAAHILSVNDLTDKVCRQADERQNQKK